MTKITVTDATGTKTVDMTIDTLSLTSTGAATWTISDEGGGVIQYTRRPDDVALSKKTEPNVWSIPQQVKPYITAPYWRASGGVEYPLNFDNVDNNVPSTIFAIFENSGDVPQLIGWKITPPDGAADGAPYARYLSELPMTPPTSGPLVPPA